AARIRLRPRPALLRPARGSPVSKADPTGTVERDRHPRACHRTGDSRRTAEPAARDLGKRRAERKPSSITRPLRPPVLRPDRPTLVIAPTARYLEITRRVTLELESQAPDERYRRRILGLDVRLEAVQPMLVERELNHCRDSCTHVAATLVRLEREVAQV